MNKIKLRYILGNIAATIATPFVALWVILAAIIITVGFSILWVGIFMIRDYPSSFTEWSDIKNFWKFKK